MQQIDGQKNRMTVGVLAGAQLYYRTILGDFAGPVLHGIASAARDYGCNLLLSCGMDHTMAATRPGWPVPGADVDFLPVGPWNCDGLVVLNPLLSESRSRYIHDLIARGMPVTFIAAGEPGPTVAVDNTSGIHQAVAHLVAHGHRRIAFLAGDPRDTKGDSRVRLDAYLDAVREFNLADDPRLVVYSYHSIDGGKLAMQQLLESGVSFTAVVASNDGAAIGALTALRDTNLRVPQDVAVTGFDDILDASTQTPSLTTLHYSPSEMGYRAVELLLEYIVNPGKEIETIKIPMRLIPRHSCGCYPDARIMAYDDALPQIVPCQDRPMAMARLVQAMTECAMSEAQRLCVEEVHALCSRLVEALVSSAKFGKAATFYRTLDEILAQTEAGMEDVHIWHAAAAVLENHLNLLVGTGRLSLMRESLEMMVHRMRFMVTDSMRRQFRWQAVREQWVVDCTGQLAADLFNAMSESQIFEAMAESLPRMGIERVDIAFFEPAGDDPVAWSRVHSVPQRGEASYRVLTRQFPVPDLYTEPFRLALLPLRLEDRSGFMVFDVTKLEVYGSIVWQLGTFFRTVRLYQEATEGRRLAEDANRFKSRFLSMVSHELRTPLSLIIGLSEMILRDDTADETVRRRDLETILASARDLDTLLRDVLALSCADVDQLQLTCEVFDLAEVLRAVAVVGRQLAGDKDLTWCADIPQRLPPVWGDSARLRQVVANLVSNAVKFTRKGGVTLRAVSDETDITVSVTDSGPGVPQDEHAAVFEAFHQSTRTSGRGYGGLGLGLSICKLLVEMHKGRIGVESSGSEGDGATFFFSIPRYRVAEAVQTETSPVPPAPPPADILDVGRADGAQSLKTRRARQGFLEVKYLHKPVSVADLTLALERQGMDPKSAAGKTVLIVDDEPHILQMHARMIKLWSPETRVLEAKGGQEALALMRETTPDLVLLDLMMPELGGFKVLDAMREAPATRDVPIIVVTAQVLTQEDMTRLNRGVASVLQKDIFSVPEMLSHVSGVLDHRRVMSAPAQVLARKAMGYIHEHYDGELSLDVVADDLGVSKEYLARCFREEVGVTLVTYLNRYRIERAKVLLRENQKRVIDVALEVGFSSGTYFSRVFKQEVGQSPREYRQIV